MILVQLMAICIVKYWPSPEPPCQWFYYQLNHNAKQNCSCNQQLPVYLSTQIVFFSMQSKTSPKSLQSWKSVGNRGFFGGLRSEKNSRLEFQPENSTHTFWSYPALPVSGWKEDQSIVVIVCYYIVYFCQLNSNRTSKAWLVPFEVSHLQVPVLHLYFKLWD